MNITRLSTRERQLAVAAAAVIGCWAAVAWLVLPLWDRAQRLGEQAANARRRLEAMQRLITREGDVARRDASYAAFHAASTGAPTAPSLLDALEEWARADGVQISLKPRPVRREGEVTRAAVEVDIEGGQDALLAFLRRILSQPALIELDRLKITMTAAAERPLRASLLVTQMTLPP